MIRELASRLLEQTSTVVTVLLASEPEIDTLSPAMLHQLHLLQ
jgi:hypothetical protein